MSGIADVLKDIVLALGTGENNRAMLERLGPNWREDIDFQRATRASTLRQNEMGEAKGRLTLADQLSNLIGTAAMGQADMAGDMQRTAPPMTLGGDVPVDPSQPVDRGYAVNMPMAETMTPDPADVVPDDLGELTGFDRDALVRMGLGKAAQSKRALAELRGDQSLAQIDARATAAAGRDERNNAFRRSLEEFKQGGRLDIARLTAGLRRQLEEYRQGQQNSRFDRGLDSSEDRFYDKLEQSASQWEQSQDLREMSARRQVLSAQLDRDANLTPEGRAQIVFELGVINGRLANMGLNPGGAVTPQAQPGTPGPRNPSSTRVPNGATAARPVVVSSPAEAAALPDGTLFTVNGRTYKKQGNGAVPVP